MWYTADSIEEFCFLLQSEIEKETCALDYISQWLTLTQQHSNPAWILLRSILPTQGINSWRCGPATVHNNVMIHIHVGHIHWFIFTTSLRTSDSRTRSGLECCIHLIFLYYFIFSRLRRTAGRVTDARLPVCHYRIRFLFSVTLWTLWSEQYTANHRGGDKIITLTNSCAWIYFSLSSCH